MAGDLSFGYVVSTISTAVNLVAGLLGRAGQSKEGEQFESEHWGHYGFDSSPHPPDDEGGRCEVLFSRSGDVSICTKDRRYRLNLASGEVAVFSGKDGKVSCHQILRPDGSVNISGSEVTIDVSRPESSPGDITLSVKRSLTLQRNKGTKSLITLKDDGAVQLVSSGGTHLTLDSKGKAILGVNGASVILDGQKAIINASEISIVGAAGVGVSPAQLPVATVGCMAGPYPIVQGSSALRAQFP